MQEKSSAIPDLPEPCALSLKAASWPSIRATSPAISRAAVQASGGVLDEQDLAEHRSTWEEAISTTYRGIRLWECPPNGQGLTALLALNILEAFDLRGLDPLSPERLHLQIEALRIAFADTGS